MIRPGPCAFHPQFQHGPAGPPGERHCSNGQILIMFALFLTGLIGAVGLATDLGFAFAQRRTVQNAADASAVAGARALLHWGTTNPSAPWNEVQAIALHTTNVIGTTNQTIASCSFVTDAGVQVGACSAGPSPAATGVRVRIEETHRTFFIRAVPGGPNTVTTGATATAHIQRFGGVITDGPFIVCGYDTRLQNGGRFSILSNNGAINPAAYNRTFQIHGPQIARCGLNNSSFKGLADQDRNEGCPASSADLCLNRYWYADNGVKAGPTREKVNGMQGCRPGDTHNCVMILPIATDNPAPVSSNPRQYYIVQLAAFYVEQTGANTHSGRLLPNYVITGPGDFGWCRDCGGINVVRQTG